MPEDPDAGIIYYRGSVGAQPSEVHYDHQWQHARPRPTAQDMKGHTERAKPLLFVSHVRLAARLPIRTLAQNDNELWERMRLDAMQCQNETNTFCQHVTLQSQTPTNVHASHDIPGSGIPMEETPSPTSPSIPHSNLYAHKCAMTQNDGKICGSFNARTSLRKHGHTRMHTHIRCRTSFAPRFANHPHCFAKASPAEGEWSRENRRQRRAP